LARAARLGLSPLLEIHSNDRIVLRRSGVLNDMADQFDLKAASADFENKVANSLDAITGHPIAYNESAAKLSCEFGKLTPQQVREVLAQMTQDENSWNNIPVVTGTDIGASGEIAGIQFRQSKWKSNDTNGSAKIYANVSQKFCSIE